VYGFSLRFVTLVWKLGNSIVLCTIIMLHKSTTVLGFGALILLDLALYLPSASVSSVFMGYISKVNFFAYFLFFTL